MRKTEMIGAVGSCHNQNETIGGTVDSIVDQREHLDCGIDIQVIDDASVPPLDLSHRFPLPDDVSVTWYREPANLGVQRIRNKGFELFRDHYLIAPPKYIIFVDGDVTFLPGAFAAMKEALDKSADNIAYAYGDYSRRGALSGYFVSAPFDARRLRVSNFVSTMSMIKFDVLARAIEQPFIEDEERLQDWSLWLRLLNAGYEGVFVDKVIFSAFYPPTGISLRDSVDFLKWREIIAKRYA